MIGSLKMTTKFSSEQLRHPYIPEEQIDYPAGWWIKNEITGAAIKIDAILGDAFQTKYEAFRLCNAMNRVYADIFDYVQSLPGIGQLHE